MPYSSSVTDEEWEIIEPLLSQILPTQKQTRPDHWTKRELLDGILYKLKNGCKWENLPEDLPAYSTVYWHYKQWRSEGILEQVMRILNTQARQRNYRKQD